MVLIGQLGTNVKRIVMKVDVAAFFLLLSYLLFLVATYSFKMKLLVVTSNSMKPAFEYGDVLLAVSQEHYQPNDIISFTANSSIVTHRIVSEKQSPKVVATNGDYLAQLKEYQTKGDANVSADLGFIAQDRVLGKVTTVIPKVGYLVLFLQAKLVVLSIIFTSLCMFVIQSIMRKKKYAT